MSSSPLNRHPHDAVPHDGAKSGLGALQRAHRAHPGEQHLIERGYVPVRQIAGKVVGLWGDAHVRHLDGTVTPLHVGDVIKKGEVVLTAQDGIVQLEARPTQFAGDDVERTITQVGNGDADVVPAAGPNSGGAGGSLEEGLRVGRDAESVTPAALEAPAPAAPVAAATPQAVAPLATAPVAHPDTGSTATNTPVTFDPRANDSSASGLTIVAIAGHPIAPGTPVTLPQGSVALNSDGTLTFTPNAGFSGSLSFAYTDADGHGATTTSTVTLDVTAPPAPQPVAAADAFGGVENTGMTGTLAGNDAPVAGESNTWSVATGPAHGTLVVNADGRYAYTPAAGYAGTDTFTYTITAANGQASTASVTLTIAPQAIAAAASSVVVTENTAVDGSLGGDVTHVAGDPDTFGVRTGPSHGTLDLRPDGSYTYTPDPGYSGNDSFSYVVTNASGQTSTATVSLGVTPQPIAASPATAAVAENGTLNGHLAGDATTVAGDPNSFSLGATHPAHGTVVVDADGSYTYTPVTGYSGSDSFSYTVTDASGQASTATVTLAVTPIAPTAAADTIALHENTPSGTLNLSGNDAPVAGEASTWSIASNPAHGTLTPAADFATSGNFTYTPATGQTGTDSFTYTVTDASGHSSTATVTLDIAPIAPAAVADTIAVLENTPSGTLSLAGNDTPVAGETNTWAVASLPAHGTLTPASDFATSGNFTYTAAAGYTGADSFSYTITDASGQASTASVTLAVAPIAPVAAADGFAVAENATSAVLDVSGNDTPVAGEANTWAISSNPAHGTLAPAADFASSGRFTYTPDAGYFGTDSFTYTITDAHGLMSTATVSLSVGPIDPTATPDAFTLPENSSSATLSVKSNDSPVAGETNTWSLTAGATHGTLTLAADFASSGNFTYTPDTGFHGTDAFTYRITDAAGQSSTATVTLTVAPIAPTAVADAIAVSENTATGTLDVSANDGPVAGEANHWAIASNPSHGTLTPAADFATSGNFTYTPEAGYVGADAFTYTITDASGLASTATVSLNVAAIDPTAAGDTFVATENATTATLNLATNDTPVAGEANTWSVASTMTAHGSITPAADFATSGKFTYTANAGFSGTDSFSYTITDGSGHASTATVTINVAAIDPTAAGDTFAATENATTGTLNLAANDAPVSGETNTWSVVSTTTAHGSITPAPDFATSGKFTYTPNAGFSGADSFSYTITDGSGHASTATVTINVAAIDPTAAGDTFAATENATTGPFNLASNDAPVAGETNTWSVASTSTAHGSITPAADFATSGKFTYTPNAGFSGTDSFSYTITDGSGHASTATVTINVAAIDPTATIDTFQAIENATTGTFNLASNDAPVAGETNTWSVASTSTAHGSITPAADFATSGKFTYTPNAGFSGADSFSYTITDGSGHASTATVTINVAAIDPTATIDTFQAIENATTGTFNLASNDAPVAGETNTWSVASTSTAHGSITPAADFATSGKFTYTPNAGFSGADSFSYTITDGSGHASTATVTIKVAAVNPTATNDTFQATENATTGKFNLASNDAPVAGETNTWSVASTSTAHGSITPAADFATSGKFTYTPNAGFSGTDSFSYTITDGSGHASTATVTINVAAVNPTATNDTFQAIENATTGTFNLASNDAPVAGETNTWSVASTTTAHGSITPAADFATSGKFTYTPTTGFSGADSFTYTVTDGSGHASTATVTINVAAINPSAANDTFQASENGTTGTLNLATNDTPVAGEANTWSVASTTTAHGSITPAADFATTGKFTYTPNAGFSGADSFTYTVTDGSGHASTATVTINVAPINPTAAGDTFAATENATTGTLNLAANDAPVAGETNTWSVASTTTAHGSITPAADFATTGKFTYTPNAGFSGTDSFAYTITDGSGHTSAATVTISVAPINPTATVDAFAATENATTGTLNLAANDAPVSGETNTWSVASTTTAHGSITPAADFATSGKFTYTPNAGFSGADSFSYTITDGSGHGSTATVTINVAAIDPTAAGDTFAAAENATTGTLNLAANDAPVAGETNTWSVASTTTAHGSITPAADFATSGKFTYTPTAGFSGADTFSYTITDGSGHASTATVTINVAPINPTATNDTFAATENATTGSLNLAANDAPVAGETNTWSVASTTTAHGSITPSADFTTSGKFTYTPNAGYSGADTFSYTITDGSGHASTAAVTINVAPINPTATNDTFAATENATTGSLNLAANDAPVAGETNTWSVASTTTAHGSITPAADFASSGQFTYTPISGFSGTDSFTYTVTDGSGHSSTATATINVAAINPTATNDSFTATENATTGTLNLSTNDAPVAGETNTWSVASTTTAHGSITPAADFATSGKFTYTPNAGFSGADSFSYTITDGSGHASTATVTINVAPINPTATNDTFAATENATTGTLNLAANDAPVSGETNTWSVASTTTAHGSITPAADFATSGKFTYMPNAGFSGTDSFAYTITDGSGHTSAATVTITVAPINPTATGDTFAATENATTGTLNLAANDAPVSGETNTWSVASTTTAHGSITPAADFATSGKFTYTPNAGFSGADSFSYTITDGSGHASTATVTINVAAIDPTAADDTFAAAENATTATLNLATNDTPVAGETNIWSVASTTTAHGNITPAADFATTGKFTYTPNAGFSGADSFTYTVTDGSGHASTATVTINVAAINPTAAGDTFAATENATTGTLNLAANDAPVAGETNTWSVASTTTAHGSITPAADFATSGKFTYTPTAGFSGADTFSYTITDGSGHASTATVTINVAPINPTAANDTFAATEDATTGTLNLAANDAPVSGETNTWSVASTTTAHGSITPAADFATSGKFTYTPNAGFSGADSFTYTVTDGSGHASTATVTITVAAIDPAAVGDTFAATENATTATLNLATNDTPVAGEANTWSVASTTTAHGSITPAADFATSGKFTYTPNAGFSGADSFTYTVTDGSGHASTATVTINVAAVNPTAANDTFQAIENATTGIFNLASNDAPVAGETNTWSVASTTTAHGSITPAADFATSGKFTYTPSSGFSGADSFTYTVTDGSGHASTATVTINVAAINPSAANDTFQASENGTTGTLNLASNDAPVAGETNSWSVASTATAHGSITPAADFATSGKFTYTPNAGFSGADSFTYTITDGSGLASTATVTINVAPINPTASNDTFAAIENTKTGTLNLAANDAPVAGETNTWSLASTSTAHGSITPAADFATSGKFTYTPTSGYSGPDSFSYTVTDGSGHASTATVTINIAAIDPAASPDTFNVVENTSTGTLSVATNDAPVAGETNAWAIASGPTHGTLTPAADFTTSGKFSYTPDAGYVGTDTFTYTITDGSGHSSTATVTLAVAPVAPFAVDDTFSTNENANTGTLSVTANDTPIAGETNTWSIVTGALHGTVTPAADFGTTGNFTYAPASGFSGTDSFTYKIIDSDGQTSTATVTINVSAVDPTAAVDTFQASENSTTGTLNLASNDTPVAGEANTWSVASTTTAHGSITPAADFATSGKFTYTPNAGFSGADSFSYTITDGSGHASTASVTINVAAINPMAANDTFAATENSTTGTLNLSANDAPVAGETNTWSVASTTTAHGVITPAADFATSGKFTYTPTAGFSGSDSFSYTITDGSGHTSTATVTINVAAINPNAANDTFAATENATTGTLNLATNDAPVAGETNTWSVASTTTAHGSITPAADFATSGKFTYTPTTGFSGADSFTYTVTDGSGHTSTATVTINVAAINPSAANDTFAATENATTATLNLATNDAPVAGETNTWSVASTTTAHGIITPAVDFATSGKFTYTPATGFSGADSFTYTVTDGSGHTSTATVTINVAAINPTAANDTFAATENATTATLNLATNDAPVAGETNTWSVASTTTAHGIITPAVDFATSGKFTYTPATGFSGADSFTYTVTDGSGHTSTATVTINVAAINPTAANDTFAATENATTGTLNLATNDAPVAGETNTWSVASTTTAHGSITPAADFATSGKFTYTPTTGFSGADSFTYTVTDGSGHTSTATVTINVAAINPSAANDTFAATENATTATLNLATNDAPVAGETNTWSVASTTTAHGIITPAVDFATSGKFTYTPTSGFSGTDSFTYTITDGSGHTSTATVTINVAAINPTATNDSFAATENATTGTLNLSTNDAPVAGETNTWSVASTTTAHGSITPAADFATSGKFTYTPTAGYSGVDSFTYTITDGSGHTSTATVTINVAAINPTATNDSFAATENATTGTLNLSTNDAPVAGETNTWSVASTTTAHGSITPAADFATSGKFTYMPTSGFSGTDSFTYTITDGSGHTSTATVTINVAAINPTATNDAFAATENATTATLNLATNDAPVAGETNTWSVASTTTAHGSITPAADFATSGKFTYTPTSGFSGTDSFTYTLTDGSGHTSTATVTINVAPINPTATNDTFAATENATTATLSVKTNDTPVAGETNTWSVASTTTAHGTVTPAADFATSGKFTYTPTSGFSGTDSFTYTITDGSGHSSTATVTINVAAINPTAANDTFAATENATTATLNLSTNDAPVAGETNTWSVASTTTAHGSITPAADFATSGKFTYTPTTGFSGADSFTYTITDGSGHASTATVTINVAAINPTATNDTFQATENGTTGTLNLATNDTPVAGEANTWSVASTTTAHGSITPAADFATSGKFTYTPTAGFSGADSFTYTITDGSGHASTATVTINVAAINPTAANDTFAAIENATTATLNLSTNDTPVAGETNTWSIASTTTAHGSITPAADFATSGKFTYTPTTGYSGADSFTYTITDGTGHTSTATVTINVAAINPTAANDTFAATENATTATLNLATNDAPVAGETNTWSVASTTTAHGSITPAADFATSGKFTYTPTAGFSGADSFTYTITDGSGHASTATVTINVAAINPTATNDSFAATENATTGTLNLSTNDAPVAGETNTWSVASTTTVHGSITPAADFASSGKFTYTPTSGFSGTDSFTYTITDGSGHSSTATVTINVAAINPTAANDTFAATENATTATLNLSTNDTPVAGETNTWSVASTTTAHGSITPAADFATSGKFTYTPTSGFSGADSFTYTITDGSGHASTATVTLNVAAINPTASNDTFQATENGTTGTLNLATNDTPVAGETNTWSVASTTTAHGSITPAADFATSGKFTYTPTSGFSGADSFTYTITDGSGHASTATVTINVAAINPTATNDSFAATENATTATLNLATNDAPVAGETNTWSIASTTTAHGSITPAADFATSGKLTYTPTAGFSGADSFTYTVTDGSGHTSTATVTINVAPINPTAGNDTFAATENATTATLSVKTNDTPVAGETNTWSVASTTTAHGSITPAADFATSGKFTYTPTTGFSGADSFTYTITDGSGHASTATVTINVAAINPTATNDSFAATENATTGTLILSTNDTPVAGETNTWSVASTTTAHGSITPAADFASSGKFTYTPTSGFSGTDSFTYTITDGSGHASTATVTINVAAINPTATNDTFQATENGTTGTLNLATNDAPVAGEANTWSVASTTTAHGSITPAADFATSGKFTYTPTAGFSGADSFTYTITDGSGHTSTATVTINVAAINPTAVNDTFQATENGTTGTLNLASNDAPVAGEANTWSVASTTTAHGSITPAADFATSGKFTYTPTSGYSGADSFTYTITDGTGHTSTATVTINVAAINPTATNDTFTATAGGPTPTLSVRTNDVPVAGETNVWSVKTNPTHGTLTPAADFASTGNFVYTPTAGYTGTDTFTYLITDGSGHTSSATVTLTVAAEKAPVATGDTYAALENTLLVLNGASGTGTHALTSNDTDANGDALTVTQINGTAIAAGGSVAVASGTVMMDANGVISFNPTTNFTGNATFNYTISDGHGGTSTANVSIAVAAGTDDPTVTATAAGRWLFNENAGTSTSDAYDNYTGTLTNVNTANGGTAPTWITGHNGTAGSALNFDGKGGIVSVPLADTAALNATSSLSVWFKTTQVGSAVGWSSPSIIGSEHSGDANDIQWGTINSKGQIGLGLGNDANGVYSTAAVNDGAWHDLTITRSVNADGTSAVSVYIDGTLSNSATLAAQSQITNGTPFNELAGFGYTNAWSGTTTSVTDGTAGDVYYKGALDDARIYNHVLTADQAKAVYNVENGYETQAVANDGDAIKLAVTDTHATALHVIGVESGMTLSDGTHTLTSTGNAQVIDVTGWNIGSLQLTNVGTGSATLEFDAINTNASTGQSEDTSTYLSVVNGTSLLGGTAGNDTLTATTSKATFISGGTGDDAITGGAGNDRLLGGTGDDTIAGGAGNDLIVGGAGNDTLTGGTGNDVFRWELGDHGTAGTPHVDTITDFSSTAGNLDVLDLRDLLGGANHTGTDPGNIASFLHFDHSGADTIIHVSSTGGFASGYSSGAEDETIVLKNVDLTSAGTHNDSQIIHQLLTNGQLHLG